MVEGKSRPADYEKQARSQHVLDQQRCHTLVAMKAYMALGFPERRSTPRSTSKELSRAIAVTLRKDLSSDCESLTERFCMPSPQRLDQCERHKNRLLGT
jgi:hypothetical protein